MKLSSKTKFSSFSEIDCSNFRFKLCEKPQSYLNFPKKIGLKGNWDKLEVKKRFHRESWTKSMGQSLVFT